MAPTNVRGPVRVENVHIDVYALGRRRWLARAATIFFGLLVLGLPFILVALAMPALPGVALIGSALIGLVSSGIWMGTLGGRRKRGGKPGTLELTSEEIRLQHGDRQERIHRDEVRAGWIEPAEKQGEKASAILQVRGEKRIVIETQDDESAAGVLDAAGVDARRRAVTMWVPAAHKSTRTICAALLVVLALLGAPWITVLLATPFLFLTGQAVAGLAAMGAMLIPVLFWLVGVLVVSTPLRSTKVTIGMDGVVLKRIRSRYLPYETIRSVRSEGGVVRFELESDELINVSTDHRTTAASVVRRIRQAMGARSDSSSRDGLKDRLARQGLSLENWRESLRQLTSQDATFRRAPVEPEELASVVEDATAQPLVRIAAATALSASSSPQLKKRVRIAADACANQRLRVALERAAEGELNEEIVEAASELRAQG